ncbi:MAG TPA: twin-arginine translocation signal domain-containing protein [Burkholderiales bacterium]|nr:twin-arginine translocation signal domain-containing protein [Burkholderiales bacterium]
MERREFMKACAAAALAAPATLDAKDLAPRFYTKSRLVDESRQPLRASRLTVGRNYIFHYPFEGTPCFLIDLGTPTVQKVALRTEDGGTYEWPGGAGPKRSVVAYSAICTHRMTYPTRQISFISYRDRATASPVSRPNTIHCCSEHSQYDPGAGARVLNGPAPQPLAAILLEHDASSDGLYAVGTLGGEMFNQFFAKYELKLELDYGSGRARQRIGAHTVVADLTRFCKQQVRC